MSSAIRVASTQDAGGVAAIYQPIVRDTAISFELEPPSAAEIATRIETTLKHLPWLVSVDEQGAVDGYVYASRHRERAAYQWSVDTTAYVRADRRGLGIGRRLYSELLQILLQLNYRQAFAGIALPNDASIGLHESVGFVALGIYRRVGYKLGAWHDVGWWQAELSSSDTAPGALIPFAEWSARECLA
jgi:phosphinothricin acetyltransferase